MISTNLRYLFLTVNLYLMSIEMPSKAVVTWSGGLDTTTLCALVMEEFDTEIYPIFVNRNQKNYEREGSAIRKFSSIFNERYKKKFNDVFEVKIPIPAQEFKELEEWYPGKKSHILRNLDIAIQAMRYAYFLDLNTVLVGSILSDVAPTFEDNSPEFWDLATRIARLGTAIKDFKIRPLFQELGWDKKDMVAWGYEHDIPLHLSWSCWYANELHCGKCSPCERRKEAYKIAGIEDRTGYLE